MRACVAVIILLAVGTPAAAQSTYIGASLVGDIARYDKIEYDEDRVSRANASTSIDGEALGFNLRVGRALGRRWGLEFEFARSGEIENRTSRAIPLIPGSSLLTIPDFEYVLETEHRYSSYGALAWYRQQLGDMVDLTYLGGIVFSRTALEQNVEITDDRLALWRDVLPDVTVTDHAVGPAIGVEAGFRLGDSAAVTAGLRVHGTNIGGRSGWLLRPNAGVRWAF